jgi:hypothetical protein
MGFRHRAPWHHSVDDVLFRLADPLHVALEGRAFDQASSSCVSEYPARILLSPDPL